MSSPILILLGFLAIVLITSAPEVVRTVLKDMKPWEKAVFMIVIVVLSLGAVLTAAVLHL